MRRNLFGNLKSLYALILVLSFMPIEARKLQVGVGKTYAKPSAAAAAAQNGDTVEIDAGIYESDACTWSANNLVIRATTKYAHMKSNGVNAQGKGIWVTTGKNIRVENIEFSGAKVPDQNGAGIRLEGQGIVISNCYFHDNENGILGDGTEIVIEFSEFDHNGLGEVGRTHNMYINTATSFTLQYCNTHNSVIGHTVKSRGQKNFILYNRIMDENGTTSYEIDLPNGGESYIIGNVIQKGPNTDNSISISYGAEGLTHANPQIYIVNNTIVDGRSSDSQGKGSFIDIANGTKSAKIINNLFVGSRKILNGTADTSGNLVTTTPGFTAAVSYDYHLLSNSPAINRGVDPGSVNGIALNPSFEYQTNASKRQRQIEGKLDIGAYEFNSTESISHPGSRSKTKLRKPSQSFFFDGTRFWNGTGNAQTDGDGVKVVRPLQARIDSKGRTSFLP